ncbi:MAG: hypothetical protein CMK09_17540 [Ponticaulis sp.]|nr:hypothetical protein [Ponticaulis sp.]
MTPTDFDDAYLLSSANSAKPDLITRQEVLNAQMQWASGIVAISKVYLDKGDYRSVASDMIRRLYDFQAGKVLFKPTLASTVPFRPNYKGALSYFIGDDYPEDNGFAIRPWANVRFGMQHIQLLNGLAFAMGHYYFTPVDEADEVKVEFTFGYRKDESGVVRIMLHHSSLPYEQS